LVKLQLALSIHGSCSLQTESLQDVYHSISTFQQNVRKTPSLMLTGRLTMMLPHQVCQVLLQQLQQLEARQTIFCTQVNSAAEELGNARDSFAAVMDKLSYSPEDEHYGAFGQVRHHEVLSNGC
jgi:hypothetical protein